MLVPGLEFEPALSVFQMTEVMSVHLSSSFDRPTASKRKRQVKYTCTRIKQVCSFLNIEHACFMNQIVSLQSFKDIDSLFKNPSKFRLKEDVSTDEKVGYRGGAKDLKSSSCL